jgi:hypothetical protein
MDRIAGLTILFGIAAVETWFKLRGLAYLSWFAFLCALTAWVASPGTMTSVVLGVGVFSTGLMLLIGYSQMEFDDWS